MNSGDLKEDLGSSGSREFLSLVEGRSVQSWPHTDNVFRGRSCGSLGPSVALTKMLPPSSQQGGRLSAAGTPGEALG